MTIKTHIAISATISLALIAIIACQQKPQAPKDEKGLNDKIKTQATKVEDTAKKAQEAAAKAEAEAKEAAKKLEEEAKAAEAKANEEIKEIETKIDEAVEKVESEVKAIESKTEDTKESDEELGPQNLLTNSDFSKGLANWYSSEGVNIVQENGKNIVEITGKAEGQIRTGQTINAISGHVYKLSFEAKSKQKDAFAIFKDEETDNKSYLYTDQSGVWKQYSKEIPVYRSGKYKVYLSCQGKGKYYYKNASLIDITNDSMNNDK